MAGGRFSALHRQPLHGVDDHVSVGADVGDLDPAGLTGAEFEGADDGEEAVDGRLEKIVIGDAPIQSCNWGKLFSQNFLNTISNLGKDYNIQIELMDFRRVTFDSHLNNPKTELKPINNYVIFDLKENSYLESISKNDNIFRVTN